MWSFIQRLFAPTREISHTADLRSGRAMLVGEIRAGDEEISSPIRRTRCVACYYRADYDAPSRGKTTRRLLEQAEVFAPRFEIAMEGGRVPVVPSKSDDFDTDDHHRLQGGGLPGFRAAEQVIRDGDQVRILGRLRDRGEQMELEPLGIEIIETAENRRKKKPTSKKRSRRRRGRRRRSR